MNSFPAGSSIRHVFPILPPFFWRKDGKPQLLTGFLFASTLFLAACRSPHVEITIENQTGASIQLLEVDYPSASFGANSLAPGAALHYRIQVQGSGPVTVIYSAPGGAQPHITGPGLTTRQQGSLEILLLPSGKAEFHMNTSAGK